MMKQANIVLGLHKESSVIKRHVTPAEVQLLVIMHAANNGRNPVLGIAFEDTERLMPKGEEVVTPIPEVKRQDRDEINRLRSIYGNKRVKALYGPNSSLPRRFIDAIDSGVQWSNENPVNEDNLLVGRRMSAEEAAANM